MKKQIRRNQMGHIENNINARIESWKKSLLDMTKRNRLLWYKPYKVGSLKLEEKYFDDPIESVLDEVDELAFNDKTWEFITEVDSIEDDEDDEDDDSEEESDIIKKRTKALANIYKKVKQESEEKGLNIGYIAVGFLEWYEREDAQTKIKTPLLLIPIKIEQDGRRAPFKISLNTDEQISLNPIIKKKFETDFNIILDDFPSDSGSHPTLSTYLAGLKKQISEESNWTIKKDIIIDTFSFQNLAIWNDLDKNKELVASNPFSRVLAGGDLSDEGFSYESGEPDLEKVKSKDSLNIYEVDSSQQEAIYRAKKGESFVIQGPPGTGKSQTITNIISEALADGKKILFVSEKAAALQVVLKRLTEVHLDDFCLALHNYKANKKEIIESIGSNLNLNKELNDPLGLRELTELFHDRIFLDKYAKELHKNIEPLNKSIYTVFGILFSLEQKPTVNFTVSDFLTISDNEYAELVYHVSLFEKESPKRRNLKAELELEEYRKILSD